MLDSKVVFCDTNFFIHLLNRESSLCDNAREYYKYFLKNGYELYVSTIAIAEFCVKGRMEDLPLRSVRVSPFGVWHAKYAGNCANALFKARATGVLKIEHRVIILNDAKMMAQAQCEGANFYITSDSESKKMYEVLQKEGKVSFTFIDIKTSTLLNFPASSTTI